MGAEIDDVQSRTRKAILLAERCGELLQEYGAKIRDVLRDGNQENEAPAVMINRSYSFGLRSIDGITTLLTADPDNALLACALCRPLYETGIRLLWASRSSDGWLRLQKYWANEDRKWAQEVVAFPELASHARTFLDSRLEVLGRSGSADAKCQPAPGIQQLLKEVEDADHSTGVLDDEDGNAAYDYANIYRMLCHGAHGHMAAIGRPSDYLRFVKAGVIKSVSALLRSTCYVGATDPRAEIQAIHGELISAWKDCHSDGAETTEQDSAG